MKNLLLFIKETLKGGYKFHFYFWIFSVIFFSLAIYFFVKETNRFLALKESEKRLEESVRRVQSLIVKIKERLKTVEELRFLTDGNDTFFILQEMSFREEKDKPPYLNLRGELIRFH